MQRIKRPPMRNKIDLADAGQVRAWSRRLRIAPDQLQAVVGKVGNSATAVAKEIELRRTAESQPYPVPPIHSPTLAPAADGELPTAI